MCPESGSWARIPAPGPRGWVGRPGTAQVRQFLARPCAAVPYRLRISLLRIVSRLPRPQLPSFDCLAVLLAYLPGGGVEAGRAQADGPGPPGARSHPAERWTVLGQARPGALSRLAACAVHPPTPRRASEQQLLSRGGWHGAWWPHRMLWAHGHRPRPAASEALRGWAGAGGVGSPLGSPIAPVPAWHGPRLPVESGEQHSRLDFQPLSL